LDSIFAVQDEITADVVNQLKITLLGEAPTVAETDSEAYSLFLQARHLWRQGSAESVDRAYRLIRQSLEIDPGYAPAWAALGTVLSYQVGLGQIPFEEGYGNAREAAIRALEIDPDYAQALSDLGWYAMALQKDFRMAAYYFRTATLIEPHNATVLGNSATFAAAIGRLDYAIEQLKKCIELDPIDSSKYTNLGAFYLATGDLENADSAFRQALEMSPDDVWTQTAVVHLRILQHRPEEALQLVEELDHEPTSLVTLPMIYSDLGLREETRSALENLSGRQGSEVPYFDVAEMYAHMGRIDEAFNALELASQNAEEMSFILTSAHLKSLHEDPRFEELLLQLGLAEEQVSSLELEPLSTE